MIKEKLNQSDNLDEIKEIALNLFDENRILQEQLSNLRDKFFNRRSEKISRDDGQLSLFDIPEPEQPLLNKQEVTITQHTRKKRGRKPLPDNLPRVEVLHDLTDEEKQFSRMGIDLGRATMCNWGMKVAEACDILLENMTKDIRNGPMINIDETTLKVIKEKRKSKSYMWVFRGGAPDKPVIMFQCHPPLCGGT